MNGFMDARPLLEGGPKGLTHALERALWHLGFVDVRIVDGRDDGGADILAVRKSEQWVIQAKWSGRDPIGRAGLDDCERAKTLYDADKCVLATNTSLNRTATQRRDVLARVGIRVDVWDGATLAAIGARMPAAVPTRPEPRSYQRAAIAALIADLSSRGRGLLVLATGLGKTVVGGEVIADYLKRNPGDKVLVVAHIKELVEQLERAMWKHLDKSIPTQILTGDKRPGSPRRRNLRDRRLRTQRSGGRLSSRAGNGGRDPPCWRDRHVPASPRCLHGRVAVRCHGHAVAR